MRFDDALFKRLFGFFSISQSQISNDKNLILLDVVNKKTYRITIEEFKKSIKAEKLQLVDEKLEIFEKGGMSNVSSHPVGFWHCEINDTIIKIPFYE